MTHENEGACLRNVTGEMDPVPPRFLRENISSVPEHAHVGDRGPSSVTQSIAAIVLAWRDFKVGVLISPAETIKEPNKREQCFPKCVLLHMCLEDVQ